MCHGRAVELSCLCVARLRPGVAPLRQRIRRHTGHGGKQHPADAERREQAALASAGALSLLGELTLALVAAAPREHRLSKHVVVDLVAGSASVCRRRAQDSFGYERREHRLELSLRDPGIASEVRRRMGDLCPGRRHQVVEDGGGDVLLLHRQRFESTVEVYPHDLPGATELGKRRCPQDVRARVHLRLPQASHDELEIRGFDAILVLVARDDTASRLAEIDAPGSDLVEDAVDEGRLDLHLLRRPDERVVVLDWPDDRATRGAAIEMREPQVVAEEIRDARP